MFSLNKNKLKTNIMHVQTDTFNKRLISNIYDQEQCDDDIDVEYFKRDKFHRVGLPAFIYCNPSYSPYDSYHRYFFNGVFHRIGGPALFCETNGIDNLEVKGDVKYVKYFYVHGEHIGWSIDGKYEQKKK